MLTMYLKRILREVLWEEQLMNLIISIQYVFIICTYNRNYLKCIFEILTAMATKPLLDKEVLGMRWKLLRRC